MLSYNKLNKLIPYSNSFLPLISHPSYNGLSTKTAEDYDVTVIGGGMVGFAFAAFTNQFASLKDKKILVLESAKDVSYKQNAEYSNRVVALSPATKKIFQKTGIWSTIEAGRFRKVNQMKVWENQSNAGITFAGPNDVAYIVENDLIISAVKKVALSCAECRFDSRVTSLPSQQDTLSEYLTVTLKDGSQLRTKLLIGADGAQSEVRKAAGIQTIQWSHKQKAIVATLNISGISENFTAWQRFLSTGPVALLPLNESQSSLVWSIKESEADRLLQLSEEEFVSELNHVLICPPQSSALVSTVMSAMDNINPSSVFHAPSISSLQTGSRAAFPLGFSHATHYTAHRLALVGDAAHRVLPLAGQGVNLGFGDAYCLAKTINKAVLNGADIGSASYLHDYETERQRFVVPVAATIEALQQLYSFTFPPLVLARSVGLKVADTFAPLKNVIVDSATKGKISIW